MTAAGPGDGEATPGAERRLVLDACTVISLYASRRMSDMLRSLPRPCAVADVVHEREALWVGRRGADHEQVDLGPLIASGLVEVLRLDGEVELTHFVALAATLDDGEAASGALAHSRRLMVATDDRAALSAFAAHDPPIPTCGTLWIVRHWARCTAVDPAVLRDVLVDIRRRAYFEPGPRDPLQPWWRAALEATS